MLQISKIAKFLILPNAGSQLKLLHTELYAYIMDTHENDPSEDL